MLNASPAPGSDTISPPPVDFEMLCELFLFQGVKFASEFKLYAADAVDCLLERYTEAGAIQGAVLHATSRLWCWLQRNLRPAEAEAAKVGLLPLPQPAQFPMKLHHLGFIADSFDDVKTQLQLIHAAVDCLQQKGKQTDAKIGRVQEHLKRIPTCRCKSHEGSTSSTAAPTTKKVSASKTTTSENRKLGVSIPTLQMDRLEVPMEIMQQPPTALQEHSSAILYWIVKAMSDGSPISLSERQSPLHAMTGETPPNRTTAQELYASTYNSAEQGQLQLQDDTNTGQAPAMDIAQIYQVLARDDPL